VEVIDKNGNKKLLQIKPSIEMRLTDSSNRRTIFYFDLVRFDGEYITGSQSRFLPLTFDKKIPIRSVKKIEIQDGRKKFRYVN